MSCVWLLLLTLTAVTCQVFVRTQTASCVTSSSDSAIRVALDSVRNATGHWAYQLGLFKFGRNIKSVISDHWSVDVHECRDKEESLFKITLTTIASSEPVKTRPLNYALIPDLGYYKYHLEIETWQRAKEICEEEGAHLAVYETEKKALALSDFLKQYSRPTSSLDNTVVWIGIYQFGVAGQPWYTISGKVFNHASVRWYQSKNPMTLANVAGMLYRDGNGSFFWASPTGKAAFLCEHEF